MRSGFLVPGALGPVRLAAASAVAGNGLLNNLLAHWTTDEASGNRADSSGNSRTMLPNNAPGNRAGKLSNAVNIEVAGGSGKYLYYDDAANALACAAGQSITISCWIYLDALPATTSYPVTRWGAAGDWTIYISSAGIVGTLVNAVTAGAAANTPVGVIGDGAWHHLIGWYDHTAGANGTVYMQVDNGTVYSTALATAKVSSARYVCIGDLGHSAVADGSFDGAIDEAAIWRGVLSEAQRAALWNGGAGLAYASFTA